MRYRTIIEHRNGGQPCEGSGQESKSCNSWVDTTNDLLTCEAKFENCTNEMEDKISEMETEIAELKQQLNNTEQGNQKLIMQNFLQIEKNSILDFKKYGSF